VIAGQVDLMLDTLPSSLPHAREGRLYRWGTSAQRLAGLPTIPAVAETVPGLKMGVWTALFVPSATARPITERLDAATQEALPQISGRFAELGFEPLVMEPKDISSYRRAEIAKWTQVIRTARITAD
jgi:tripartite-type tricarboxylate transporter receptor subunit TctC